MNSGAILYMIFWLFGTFLTYKKLSSFALKSERIIFLVLMLFSAYIGVGYFLRWPTVSIVDPVEWLLAPVGRLVEGVLGGG